jgi:hypothetical protein
VKPTREHYTERRRVTLLRGKYTARVWFYLFLALLLTCACAPEKNERLERPREPTGHPNLILILADDMRAADLEHMPKTQNLVVEQGLI